MPKKKLLFVGAGGELASKVLPLLSKSYDIVGIAGRRDDLRPYCVEMYKGNLLTGYQQLFETAFRAHQFDIIIWNPVRYFFTSLMQSTRESLHTEFDIAVALAVECLKTARKEQNFSGTFVLVSSLSAFGYRKDLATYSIVKNAQVRFAKVLAEELKGAVVVKIVAPGSVRAIPTESLGKAFISSLENEYPERVLYTVQ